MRRKAGGEYFFPPSKEGFRGQSALPSSAHGEEKAKWTRNRRILSIMHPLRTLLACFPVAAALAQEPASHDIVVYGGTSGGITAAVQAAKDGRSVVLVSPTKHLGGLTTSGLGWTDLGDSAILGGLSREFYRRVYHHYRDEKSWKLQTREEYGNRGQGGPAFNDAAEIASVFEPKVAEEIFARMLEEAKVQVVEGKLDLAKGVKMQGNRIAAIRTEDGREFSGKMFIDASYEGDLLPAAKVTFTVGREANAAHGETSSGIQVAKAAKNQLVDGIDPYVEAGNPASGLLPGVNADAGGPDGAADHRLQAYCYRMVLTDVPSNRVKIGKPEGYEEADYELLFRSIEAGQKSGFFKFDLTPNRKTDSNNTGGISTDLIGGNYGPGWDWTTLGHKERKSLAYRHEKWQQGLLWTLQNHPRVPEQIRESHAKWGLPKDEFTDNGHWPWQLYVREARRMVSGYVMNEDNCTGRRTAADAVGLAAYSMDSHHVQRHVKDGMVKNEGDVQIHGVKPYPVSYRSLVPRKGECENLLVPWSLSATHMAFGSIRMEPVFMVLGQSAAIAADLALDLGLAAQDVDYAALRPLLLAAGQALGKSSPENPTAVVDNDDSALVSIKGEWKPSAASAGYFGKDYLHDDGTNRGEKEIFYRLPQGNMGPRTVSVRWTSHGNRASNARIEVLHHGGSAVLSVDQRSGGGTWHPLGEFEFTGASGEGVRISNLDADGHIVADAVGFSPPAPRAAAAPGASNLIKHLAAGHSRKVVVYGTSLTANGGWVPQMQTWLAGSYPGRCELINSGMSGKNSAEGLRRLEEKVLKHHPDTVFIEFAVNDAFLYDDGTPRLSITAARQNLEAMIDAVLKRNPAAEVILQTMNVAWDSPEGSNASASRRPNLADYYSMYREVAKERSLLLVDHARNWEDFSKKNPAAFRALVPDGVHPLPAGTGQITLPLLKRSLAGEP